MPHKFSMAGNSKGLITEKALPICTSIKAKSMVQLPKTSENLQASPTFWTG